MGAAVEELYQPAAVRTKTVKPNATPRVQKTAILKIREELPRD
jgi:hypothetical protein